MKRRLGAREGIKKKLSWEEQVRNVSDGGGALLKLYRIYFYHYFPPRTGLDCARSRQGTYKTRGGTHIRGVEINIAVTAGIY